MGCDIHLFVEVNEDGEWRNADTKKRNPWHDKYPDEEPEFNFVEIYDGRNYDLFAILADVRNGHGFAGIKTGDGLNPICAPKGLPSDASPEVKQQSDGWGVDGHSHSWHTLQTLEEYDWGQETRKCGVVGLVDFGKYLQLGRPVSYAGDVSGPRIRYVGVAEMARIIKPIHPKVMRINALQDELAPIRSEMFEIEWAERQAAMDAKAALPAPCSGEQAETTDLAVVEKNPRSAELEEQEAKILAELDPLLEEVLGKYEDPSALQNVRVRLDWVEPYKDLVGSFYTKTLPRLRELGEQYGSDCVRIVFWFDN